MECSELVGYVASALVFATFCMNSMTMLRLLALISNVAFITYACLGDLLPILALHVALLPLNAWRLLQSMPEIAAPNPTPSSRDTGDGRALSGVSGRRCQCRHRAPRVWRGQPNI